MADQGAERQLVVFDLAGEVYGVNIETVREIIRMQTVTYVPDAPKFVEGVINLRGRVIPVVDLRKRFSLTQSEATEESRVVVVDGGHCRKEHQDGRHDHDGPLNEVGIYRRDNAPGNAVEHQHRARYGHANVRV